MRFVAVPRSFGVGKAAAWEARLMRRGGLSIIMQGPLHVANAAAVLHNARRWRSLFPRAQIVLSVSTSDVAGLEKRPSLLRRLSAHAAVMPSTSGELHGLCDTIVRADEAEVLPPLKFGETAPNHGNVQIAAARAGLRQAKGTYTLRVRNDLSFHDRSFLRYYFDHALAPRRAPFALIDRVMISHLFTLNPYGLERLPFHFSDFFHFGRTADIRTIWMDLPDIPRADSSYYDVHSHADHSNGLERKFRTRLGVEQHIHFHMARRVFPDVQLDFHNDYSSVEASLDYLLNDYIICDMAGCRADFPKWGALFTEPLMRVLCLTGEDWTILNEMDDPRVRAIYLKAKTAAWQRATGTG